MSSYADINPIEARIPAERQNAKRHYGVHPYFTRRPPNVVRKYIQHYSKEGDYVLDPFGGSGITAVEAFLENRVGVQNDINPLANFIARGIADLADGDLTDYQEALSFVKERCQTRLEEVRLGDERFLRKMLKSVSLPDDVGLPTTSDVSNYHELFTTRQLISLAILKEEVEKVKDRKARNGMRLAWSATLSKLNKTFLSAEGRAESRGGSSIFSIYRYKVAKTPVELPPWKTFYERALNILAAKKEIDAAIDLKKRTSGWRGDFEVYSYDVGELAERFSGSVDYIFTDPPYGGHISYIDLSVLWNSWLGITPKLPARKKELIVGGELRLSEEVYIKRLQESMQSCVKMLKKNRWLSVVFQHWNIEYFKAILTGCAEEGAELRAAISQVGDPIWSMHKKKNKETVLAGELILSFFKSGHRQQPKTDATFDVSKSIRAILSHHKSDRLYGELLFNRITIDAWRNSAIDSLTINRDEFVRLVEDCGWSYDENKHFWVRQNTWDLHLFKE